jgi:hypothetical protein
MEPVMWLEERARTPISENEMFDEEVDSWVKRSYE